MSASQNDITNEKLNTLEINQAFHEESIQALEKTVAEQHQEIQTLHKQLALLSEYLKTLRQDAIKNPSDEVPPPHY